MNTGKTLFAQLMDFLPWSTFGRIVTRYGGDRTVRTLSCAANFRVMAFAQLTYRESLRDTCHHRNRARQTEEDCTLQHDCLGVIATPAALSPPLVRTPSVAPPVGAHLLHSATPPIGADTHCIAIGLPVCCPA